jgi:hypothetical protein
MSEGTKNPARITAGRMIIKLRRVLIPLVRLFLLRPLRR